MRARKEGARRKLRAGAQATGCAVLQMNNRPKAHIEGKSRLVHPIRVQMPRSERRPIAGRQRQSTPRVGFAAICAISLKRRFMKKTEPSKRLRFNRSAPSSGCPNAGEESVRRFFQTIGFAGKLMGRRQHLL